MSSTPETQIDLSDWLANEMTLNAESEIIQEIYQINEGCTANYRGQSVQSFCLSAYTKLNSVLGKHKIWDIKEGILINLKTEAIVLCGAGALQVLEGESQFGYWSTAFEDPRDKAAVDFGFYLAGEYPDGISPEEFSIELTSDILSQFQPPDTIPQTDPVKQTNTYLPGAFNYYGE